MDLVGMVIKKLEKDDLPDRSKIQQVDEVKNPFI